MNNLRKGPALALGLMMAWSPLPVLAKSKGAAPAAKKAAPEKKAAAGGGVILDNFDRIDWASAKDAGSELKLSQAQGKNGSALKISYLMGTGKWVAINKSFSIPSFRGKAISFWMKGKGAANNLEIKLVDEDDTNYGVKRPSLTTDGDWAQVTFTEADFSYWWGGDQSLGAVKDLYIAVAAAGDGGSGEVLISDLRLVAANPAGALAKDGLVADGSSLESWTLAKGEGANATLFSGAGLKGKAVGVQYSIPANQWVAIRKTINADLSAGNAALVLRIKGEGDPNNVEVKVVDRDESTFGKVFPGMGASNAWQEVRIPLSNMEYLWGGDNRLDATLIRHLDIAISGPGGEGKILINDIRVQK